MAKKNTKKNKNSIKKKELVSKKKESEIIKEKPFKKLFTYYLISRICLILVMFLAEIIISNTDNTIYDDVLLLFDNYHYLNIANDGYVFEYLYAFFPLTPLLIRYLGKAGFLILNQILVFGASYLLYLISRDVFKKENPFYASLLFLISPIAIFTCMYYSEALFIFLTILAFYLYKTKKSYLWFGITLGLSVCTRSPGSLLFFALFVFMFIDFIKKKEKFKNILISYVPATIISCLYPIYLFIKTGNPLYFVDVQFEYWAKISTNIFTVFIDAAKIIFNDFYLICFLDYLLVLGLFIFIITYIIKHRKDRNYWELFLYFAFTLVAISSTIKKDPSTVASFYRYIFCCFPIYLIIKEKDFNTILMVAITGTVSFMFLLGIHFY